MRSSTDFLLENFAEIFISDAVFPAEFFYIFDGIKIFGEIKTGFFNNGMIFFLWGKREFTTGKLQNESEDLRQTNDQLIFIAVQEQIS